MTTDDLNQQDRHERHDIIRGTGSVEWAPGHPTEEDLAKAKAWAEAHPDESGPQESEK